MKTLGHWELLRKLGSGAYGEVFLASGKNRKSAPLCAVKLVHRHLAAQPEIRRSLEEEAWAASLLAHPNVVEIYEVGEAEGVPFLAMEFIQGQSLAALLRKMNEADQLLTVEEAAYAVNQAALGLHYAHEVKGPKGEVLGLVHRDISPHNLIASDDGRVKVVDFGLARVAANQQTKTESIEGKMAYMPPEQINGERLDRRVDIFALGAVLWELLAGTKMYPGKGAAELLQQALLQPPPDVNAALPDVPDALREVIVRATARDKARRYQSALELAEALEPFITDDAAKKLGTRIRQYFERQPRTREEALGIAPPPEKPVRRKTTISVPAAKPPTAAPRRTRSVEKPQKPSAERKPLKLGPLIALAMLLAIAFAAYLFKDRLSELSQAAGLVANAMQKSANDEAAPDAGAVASTELPANKPSPRKLAPATLVLQSDEPAMVSENNKPLGMTPLTIQLAPGKHRLKLQTVSGDRSEQLELLLKSGEQAQRRVVFAD